MTFVNSGMPRACRCEETTKAQGLVLFEKALSLIQEETIPVVGIDGVALDQASGRILAEPVFAASMVPPFDNAALDGCAMYPGILTGLGPWTTPLADWTTMGARSSPVRRRHIPCMQST